MPEQEISDNTNGSGKKIALVPFLAKDFHFFTFFYCKYPDF